MVADSAAVQTPEAVRERLLKITTTFSASFLRPKKISLHFAITTQTKRIPAPPAGRVRFFPLHRPRPHSSFSFPLPPQASAPAWSRGFHIPRDRAGWERCPAGARLHTRRSTDNWAQSG